jgi:hypothetical protein
MNKKSTGYTGSTPISAGAFYAPYIPLQVYINPYKLTWRNYLQNMANNLEGCETSEIIVLVWKKMQDQYPGAYSVVIDSELPKEHVFETRYGPVSVRGLRLRLDFADPADETWFLLNYE